MIKVLYIKRSGSFRARITRCHTGTSRRGIEYTSLGFLILEVADGAHIVGSTVSYWIEHNNKFQMNLLHSLCKSAGLETTKNKNYLNRAIKGCSCYPEPLLLGKAVTINAVSSSKINPSTGYPYINVRFD